VAAAATRQLRASLRSLAAETPRQPQQAELAPSDSKPATLPAPAHEMPAEPVAGPTQAPVREKPAEPVAATMQAPARETARGVLPIPDDYLEAKQLTEIPRPLSEPPLAELERIVSRAGAVRMTLFIDESGKVVAIDVQSASLPQDAVLRAAEIFSEVRFSPGRIGAIAVKSRLGITVGAVSSRSYSN